MQRRTQSIIKAALATVATTSLVVLSVGLLQVPAQAATESMAVDFAVTHGSPQYYGAGLLHGITDRAPAPANVLPLKPYLWRLGLPAYVALNPSYDYFDVQARVADSAPQQEEAVLSDYRSLSPYSGMSWTDMCQALTTRAVSAGLNPIWDILNEPNWSWSWLSSSATDWDACFDGVKAADADATTAGPSIGTDDIASIEQFLLYQKGKGKLPDIITWHFSASQDVESQVSGLRAWMSSNGISPRPISVQEVLDSAHLFYPGNAVAYFAAAERAQVSIAHACWNETAPPNNNDCMQPMLDGLLTNDGQRRGEWYAYADYSGMTGSLVSTTSSNIANADGLATTDSSKATVLLGAANSWAGGTVNLNLSHLTSSGFLGSSSGSVRVVVQNIPNGTAAADQTLVSNSIVSYSGNALSVAVPVGQYNAVRVTIEPSTSTFADNIEYPSALPSALPTVAIRGSSNELEIREYNGSWSAWQNLGGTMASDPAVDAQNQSNVDIWYRGTDNRLKQVYNSGTGWSSVVDFAGPTGGTFVGDPSVVSWGTGNVTIAVRGTDNVLYTKTISGGVAGSWVSLGVTLTSDPAIESQGANLLDVFWTGATGTLKQIYNTGSGWSSVVDLGGSITGKPSAAAWGYHDVTVVAKGTNGDVWANTFHSTAWSGWQDLGYATSASPSIAIEAAGHRDLYYSNGGDVYQLWDVGAGWQGPSNTGGSPSGAPGSIG